MDFRRSILESAKEAARVDSLGTAAFAHLLDPMDFTCGTVAVGTTSDLRVITQYSPEIVTQRNNNFRDLLKRGVDLPKILDLVSSDSEEDGRVLNPKQPKPTELIPESLPAKRVKQEVQFENYDHPNLTQNQNQEMYCNKENIIPFSEVRSSQESTEQDEDFQIPLTQITQHHTKREAPPNVVKFKGHTYFLQDRHRSVQGKSSYYYRCQSARSSSWKGTNDHCGRIQWHTN